METVRLKHRRVLSDSKAIQHTRKPGHSSQRTLSVPQSIAKHKKCSRRQLQTKIKPSKRSCRKINTKKRPFEQKTASTCDSTLTKSVELQKLSLLIASTYSKQGHSPTTSSEFYQIGQKVGVGSFSTVYQGIHKLTGKKVALKFLSSTRKVSKVNQEVFIMNRVHHPRIPRVLETWKTSEQLCIVQEYVGGPNLSHLLKLRHKFPEHQAKAFYVQILEAVEACHKQLVAHRDIKLDNILLTSDFKQVKLCDFGASRMVRPGEQLCDQCGTPAYLAPEVLIEASYDPFPVDVWSLGVVLYVLLTGNMPFTGHSLDDLQKTICKGKFLLCSELSAEANDLITRILNPVPYLRPSITEIKTHPWLRTVNSSFKAQTPSYTHYELLETMRSFGFPTKAVIKSLRFKELNHATATYFLLTL